MAGTIQRHKRGGLYFEDFRSEILTNIVTRNGNEMDNMLFSNMTFNPNCSTSTATSARPRPIWDSR